MSLMIENPENLKQLRRELRAEGYKIKTEVVGFNDLSRTERRFGEIFDKETGENTLIGGVTTREHMEKHKRAYDIVEKWRNPETGKLQL